MPGYLVDEGGERTHAVLPLDEYENLRKAAERLESVRGYAMEMISAMGEDEKGAVGGEAPGGAAGNAAGNAAAPTHETPEHENSGDDQQDRAWYQRT